MVLYCITIGGAVVITYCITRDVNRALT